MLVETIGRWAALLLNTVAVGGAAALLAGGVGVAGGWLLARTDLPGRRVIWCAALLLACLPLAATVTLLLAVIPLWSIPSSVWSAGALYGLFFAPLALLLATAVFKQGIPGLEEAARLDASAWRVFWRVTLPEAAGGLVMIGLLVGFLAATDLTIVDLLRVRTFAEEVYTQFALARLPSGPLLTALPIFLILLALLLGGRRRLLRTAAPDLEAAPLPRTRLGRLGPVLAVLAALGGGAGLFIVMLALARVLGTAAEVLAALRSIAPDLRVTATLSLVSAVLIVVLAWPAARGALRPGWTGRILQLGVLALLALPAPVAGVGLITLLNQPGPLGEVYDSPAILVIGYLVRFWPVGVLLLIPAALRIAPELLDAGRVDGCGPIRLEWSISLPQARPALLAVLLISLILCIGEIGCSILIAPPGWSPVSVRAFTLMHFGVYRDLAVLAIVSIGLAAGPWLGLYRLLSQRMRTGT